MKQIGTILSFEYMGYLKNKTFRVATVILIAVILIASAFPRINSAVQSISGPGEKGKALLIATSAGSGGSLAATADVDILNEIADDYEWETDTDSTDPKVAIEDGEYDVALVFGEGMTYKLYGLGHNFSMYSLVGALDAYFTEAARVSAIQSLPSEVRTGAEQALAIVVNGEIESVDGGDATSNYFLSYLMLYLLFMVMVMYGQFVIASVVNEKSTKAMELLITSAKPVQLMFGKVLGVGCAALTQLLLIIIAAAAGLLINFQSWKEQFPDAATGFVSTNLSAGLVIFFLAFFLCGYFLYAFIYAALGSTVSKIEDASAVTTLPQLIVIAAFIVSMIGMTNIDMAYVKVLSYIPFFSPFIMFARLSMGEAGYLQSIISLALLAAAVVLFSWVAAKIYRIGVMMYGKPMRLKDIAKAAVQR
ncbi:MAG: ABC transporter permease [Clostridiales Family XIII bacterium]|jgi:ABC-2 type transport system permease protein|nr:ABC transporter permease [Clostridiales Family XIII bacterium]